MIEEEEVGEPHGSTEIIENVTKSIPELRSKPQVRHTAIIILITTGSTATLELVDITALDNRSYGED